MATIGRRVFSALRSEGAGTTRESVAIGVGAFIGSLPLYGFHLALCIGVGWLLGLNRLKMYLAANISNPLFAPLLLFSEVQAGSLLRRGHLHSVSLQAVGSTELRVYGADLVVGSLGVGAVLGLAMGLLTYCSLRGSGRDAAFIDLVRAAAERFVPVSITAWEFAWGKLRGDPLYRAVVCGGVLPGGERLLDLGCGSGLMLALLAEARVRWYAGTWAPTLGRPAVYERMTGIDIRPRVVRVASVALGDAADVIIGDARELPPSAFDAVLMCDLLHMIGDVEQEQVVASALRSLRPDGVLIIREADACGGWRFLAVRVGNRLKALAFGHWNQRFHYRTRDEWTSLFERAGLTVLAMPNGYGTPFASLLFRLTATRAASATVRTPAHAG